MFLHVIVLCQHQPHILHKPHPFSLNSFIYEIWCSFTFCPYSESTWKCVSKLDKRISVKILLHANIRARKAALVRNYFSRHNNFHLHSSRLSSLSHLLNIFWPNKHTVFKRVNYLYLATFTCPIVCLYPVLT